MPMFEGIRLNKTGGQFNTVMLDSKRHSGWLNTTCQAGWWCYLRAVAGQGVGVGHGHVNKSIKVNNES